MMRGWILATVLTAAGCTEAHYHLGNQDADVDSGRLDATDDGGATDAEPDADEPDADTTDAGPDSSVPDADQPDSDEPDVVEPCEATYYRDEDGDGYGMIFAPTTVGCDDPIPEGYVDNADDCHDGNPWAHPGQIHFFTMHRGDGAWDWDCDGEVTLERTAMLHSPKWCIDDVPQGEMPGWHISCPEPVVTNTYCLVELYPPGCGESAMWRTTCGYGEVTPQGCR